jgi:hypothetical protein
LLRLLAILLLLPALAWAQQQSIDPRLAVPMVQALQAEIALRDALLKTEREDQDKRDAALADWFRGWFGNKPVVEK